MADYSSELTDILNESFTIDTTKPFYEETIDEHLTNLIDLTNRTIILSSNEIIVQGDSNSAVKTFVVQRTYDGVDLSEKDIKIIYERSDGQGDVVDVVNIEVSTNYVKFAWLLNKHALYASGTLKFCVSFTGLDEKGAEYELKTKYVTIDVSVETLDKQDAVDPVQSWVETVDSRLETLESNGGGGGEVNVQSDWNQTDLSADDYIKNKPSSLPASDVSEWAKAETKPVYTASEVGALSSDTTIPIITNDLTNELKTQYDAAYQHSQATHAPTNAQKNVQPNWSQTDSTADNFIIDKPTIPTNTSDLTNDSGFLTTPHIILDLSSASDMILSYTFTPEETTIMYNQLNSIVDENNVVTKSVYAKMTKINEFGSFLMFCNCDILVSPYPAVDNNPAYNDYYLSFIVNFGNTLLYSFGITYDSATSTRTCELSTSNIYDDLPIMNTTTTGCAKLGSGLSITDGVLSADYKTAPIIADTTSTSVTIEIIPNKLYQFGTLSSLNITLATPTDSTVVNEYMIEFVSGTTATSLTLPSTIKWIQTPTIEVSKTYQINILNNLAVIGGA